MLHLLTLKGCIASKVFGLTATLLGLAVGLAVAGCGPGEQEVQQQSNLKPLAILYGRFMSQHRGQPPKDEAEFRDFVKQLSQVELDALGVKDIEGLFVSSRDSQPYVVRYGQATGPPGPAGQPVVVYEQQGVDGERYVGSTLGAIEAVDEARFRELVPDAK